MTTKKNRYNNVKINIITKENNQDLSMVMRKVYQIILNSKTSEC